MWGVWEHRPAGTAATEGQRAPQDRAATAGRMGQGQSREAVEDGQRREPAARAPGASRENVIGPISHFKAIYSAFMAWWYSYPLEVSNKPQRATEAAREGISRRGMGESTQGPREWLE